MKKNLFDLNPGESVIRQEAGVLMLGGLKNRMGRIVLTNQRLVFVKKNPFLAMMFGLLGVLIEHFIEKHMKTMALDLPLSHILRFEHGSFGLNKKVILFHSKDGQVHKIGTTKSYEEWEEELSKVLKK